MTTTTEVETGVGVEVPVSPVLHVEPEMFRWAIRHSGKTSEYFTDRFGWLTGWEDHEIQPTAAQLEEFAKAAYVPLGYMLFSKPPVEKLPVLDLRRYTRTSPAQSPPHPQPARPPIDTNQKAWWRRMFNGHINASCLLSENPNLKRSLTPMFSYLRAARAIIPVQLTTVACSLCVLCFASPADAVSGADAAKTQKKTPGRLVRVVGLPLVDGQTVGVRVRVAKGTASVLFSARSGGGTVSRSWKLKRGVHRLALNLKAGRYVVRVSSRGRVLLNRTILVNQPGGGSRGVSHGGGSSTRGQANQPGGVSHGGGGGGVNQPVAAASKTHPFHRPRPPAPPARACPAGRGVQERLAPGQSSNDLDLSVLHSPYSLALRDVLRDYSNLLAGEIPGYTDRGEIPAQAAALKDKISEINDCAERLIGDIPAGNGDIKQTLRDLQTTVRLERVFVEVREQQLAATPRRPAISNDIPDSVPDRPAERWFEVIRPDSKPLADLLDLRSLVYHKGEGGVDYGSYSHAYQFKLGAAPDVFFKPIFDEKAHGEDETFKSIRGLLGLKTGDSRFSERAVATYLLDRLLDANVIPQTRFATATIPDREGTASEVYGTAMNAARGDTVKGWFADKFAYPDLADKKRYRDRLFADALFPELSSRLNLLDVLAGQIDRNVYNVFVSLDGDNYDGRAVSLEGIDNDLSFPLGDDLPIDQTTPIDQRRRPASGPGVYFQFYPGLAVYADEYVSNGILALTATNIRDVFTGILEPEAVNVLIGRLARLKALLREKAARHELVPSGEWQFAKRVMNFGYNDPNEKGYPASWASPRSERFDFFEGIN